MIGPALTTCVLLIAYVTLEFAGPRLAKSLVNFLNSFEDRMNEEARCEYRAYTTDFDVILETETDLDRLLGPVPVSCRQEWQDLWRRFETGLMGSKLRLRTAAAEACVRITSAIQPDRREDIVVSLLLDQSGSMRGEKILHAAVALHIVEDMLLALGIRVELLGFTTSRWRGGSSRERWLDCGRPANPGRLNDLLHIAYRNAADTGPSEPAVFRSMLRPDVLKENIDGEAVEWAEARLLGCPESRALLVLISDGAPCDDATLSANPPDCLVRHLRKVIGGVEARGFVEAGTLGIGYIDGDCCFSQAICAETAEEIGPALLELIEDMLLARGGETAPPAAA